MGQPAMSTNATVSLKHRPPSPQGRALGIGIVGAGFIVRDCHLPAYADAGFRVVGLTSRSIERARATAALAGVPRTYGSVEEMLDDPAVDVVDIAVPPSEQPNIIDRVIAHPRRVRGILAQKPLAMSFNEASRVVTACARAGVLLQVNQNMRYDHSVRALKSLIDEGVLGAPVLATIEMRAIPHWMPWAEQGRSLSTFVMSIHHLDTFRYWLGDPARVLSSTRRDPRTSFPHSDGINLYVLEYKGGAAPPAGMTCGPGRHARGPHPISQSGGASRVLKAWPRAQSAGPAGPIACPARLTIPRSVTRAPGIARAGMKPGFPTPSQARWEACSTPSKPEASPTSPAATT